MARIIANVRKIVLIGLLELNGMTEDLSNGPSKYYKRAPANNTEDLM